MRGRKTILTEKQHHDILKLVQEQPDITMKEIVETLHLPVGDEAVRRFLIKQGYTYKKKSFESFDSSKYIDSISSINTDLSTGSSLYSNC